MTATMQGKDFNAIIEATKRFAAKDPRKNLSEWIRYEFSKETQSIKAIAIDGFKLSTESSLCGSVDEDFIIYVKPSIRKVSKGIIIIKIDGENAFIDDGETIIGYKQPKGEYLDWRKVIDDISKKPVTYEISFNGNLLIEALQSAKATLGDFRQPITLEFRSPLEPIILRTGKDNVKLVLPLRRAKQ